MGFAADLSHLTKQPIRYIGIAVWHSNLTKKNTSDLERVQKCALRVILGEKYLNYKNALEIMKLDTLEKRREHCVLNLQNSA